MKKLSAIFLLAIYIATVAFTGVAFAENCSGWKYYDSNLEECVTCPNSGFTITTTGLVEGATFLFSMSPKGSFAVDWGDGNIQNIDRDNTTAEEYSHTYTTSGSKTIKFCGKATEYNMATGDDVVAAISFYKATNGTQDKIASISGSLGTIFPTLYNTPAGQPRFRSTFQNANRIKNIPAELFTGVTGSADGMFRSTFDKCSSLTSIPEGLFSGASGGDNNMFRSTFYQCTALASIPKNLFAGITEAGVNEFKYTFFRTTGLTGKYIPPDMFAGLIAITPRPNATDMWTETFKDSTLVTNCPDRTRPYTTGYESSWAGKVSCEPANDCKGANYYDPENENADENGCVACPTGYTYDTTNAKDSVNLCAIRCNAGKYLANPGDTTCTNVGDGYYSSATTVMYGSTGTRTRCADDMPTNTQTASSASQCVVFCRGTEYRDAATNTCVPCPDGYNADNTDGKTEPEHCFIRCAGGYYLATANASSCSAVGDGYYAAESMVAYGSTGSREQCSDGRQTGTLTASSAGQCRELCTGATYNDETLNTCVDCPLGYDYHTISGKTSITQCQIHCPAGTYLATANASVCSNVGIGHWATASTVNYGQTGTREDCPIGQTTETQTATGIDQCKTSCTGASYYDPENENANENGCVACPTGFTDNITNGKISINQCQKHCNAGNYMQTYTPVEYLQGDGTGAFIDTMYSITSTNVSGTVVVSPRKTVSGGSSDVGNFFGNIYGPGGFSANYKRGVFGVWLQNITENGNKANTAGPDNAFDTNKKYTVDFSIVLQSNGKTQATLNVNNGTSSTSATPYSQSNTPFNGEENTFKLFTNGAAKLVNGAILLPNGDKLYNGRIYSLQLKENNVLVLDLIPVRRNSDNALGMLNRLTGEFFENVGLGSFTAPDTPVGDDIVMCSPVGNGYYSAASDISYGDTGTRQRCPNNALTGKNNATSIYECNGVETCTGAQYPHQQTGVCTPCPSGYDDNQSDGKENITQCQILCAGGTYLKTVGNSTCTNVGNGYYAAESLVNYGSTSNRTRCSNGGATNKENASSDSECLASVADCEGATYMDSGQCTACPTGYAHNKSSGKVAETECQILCPEGSYLENAHDSACTDVGVGNWATGGPVNYGDTSVRHQCATGLTTVGYGHGADELSDCGRKLHINNKILYTKTAKSTAHTINIQPVGGQTTYYISVSETDHDLSPLHVTQGNLQYTAFDDSILYGERDFETNTRITQ